MSRLFDARLDARAIPPDLATRRVSPPGHHHRRLADLPQRSPERGPRQRRALPPAFRLASEPAHRLGLQPGSTSGLTWLSPLSCPAAHVLRLSLLPVAPSTFPARLNVTRRTRSPLPSRLPKPVHNTHFDPSLSKCPALFSLLPFPLPPPTHDSLFDLPFQRSR